MRILMTAALERELHAVKQFCQQTACVNLGLDLDFLKTGIGPRRAGRSLQMALGSQTYSLVLNLGTAGALDLKKIGIGDIFVPEKLGQPQAAAIQWERIGFPLNKLRLSSDWKTGALITSPQPVVTRYQKKKLVRISQAQAVDMEAFALYQLCQEHDLPFLTLKVISDIAESLTIVKFRGSFKRVIANLNPAVLKVLKQLKSLEQRHG